MSPLTEEIISLYENHGHEDYDGEPVSQASHMIQCAMLAMDDMSDQELVLAAFLHDIGHLLKHTIDTEDMNGFGVVDHEGIGARYLKQRGFSERIVAIVGGHVAAKRYLVAMEPSYREKLSEASLQTLQWQGGPMAKEEADNFRNSRYFEDIIHVRLWDEQAKVQEKCQLPLSYFKNLLDDYLADQNIS